MGKLKSPYDAAKKALSDRTLYWTKFGKTYHTHTDCSALGINDPLTEGTLDQVIAAIVTRLCKFCAKRTELKLRNSFPESLLYARNYLG